ncbi:hypothetical protein Taro_032586 [Colocasia esculenta]|uniref:UBN2 domain-containing protein n=1 Tax=Colocasia esculenta TaxID=4460 RepID=A0A843VZI3_COLES|nr:hypothetical protein [Colocasia esculenta]
MSQNSKAKSILCCSLSKKEFNRISASKSAKEMWDKLRLTYEGTDKIDNHLVTFEVCKHRRKCLSKRVFLSKSLHTSMLPVFFQK